MKKVNWNTEKAVDSFEKQLRDIEFMIKHTDTDWQNYWSDDNAKEKECEIMWNLWDNLKLAFEDEFGVRL